MRALFLAIGLALACCGGAFADAASDCVQNKNTDLSIRGCSRLLEGEGTEANRDTAYNERALAYFSKGDYARAIADLKSSHPPSSRCCGLLSPPRHRLSTQRGY